MDEHTIAAFFDEFRKIALEKVAVSGGQLSPSSAPKTSAPTPAPAAKVAPTPAAKPPVSGPPAPAGGGLARIRNPGLRSQVANTRRLSAFGAKAPPVNRGTLLPKKTPAPNLRAVTTMPVRRPSKPAFIPGNQDMGKYMKPLSSADLGI